MRMPKGFENSRFDNDKGVKEGSAADNARDAKQVRVFEKAKAKAKGTGKPAPKKGRR